MSDECSASRTGYCLREAESETACHTEAGECVHGGRTHRCPRCGEDLSGYDDDDLVYRTGDERPYCSGECVFAAYRADAQEKVKET